MASFGYLQTLPGLLFGILWTIVLPASGSEYCTAGNYYGLHRYSYYLYCPGSCCGSYSSRYCCNYYNWTGGTIAGIVIGCIVGLSLLVTLLVCLCAACNKRSTTGRVVHPTTNTQQPAVAVINTHTHTGAYPQQAMAHTSFAAQGSAYPSQAYPPPPPVYNPQDPAYPPATQGQFVPPPKYSAS